MTQLCLQELEHQGLSEYNQVLRDTGYDAACCKCCDLWRVALVERFGQDEQWPKLRLNMTKLDFFRHERWYTWYILVLAG